MNWAKKKCRCCHPASTATSPVLTSFLLLPHLVALLHTTTATTAILILFFFSKNKKKTNKKVWPRFLSRYFFSVAFRLLFFPLQWHWIKVIERVRLEKTCRQSFPVFIFLFATGRLSCGDTFLECGHTNGFYSNALLSLF